ncbi:Gibberellin regulated protein [Arabidopsis suecica]|uniref:Gibberellin regulated protein n=1 Tax=Arabidopsis suecica TaxID=45249 RepID=A0A8T2BAZ7_ARASU|nr:Gibberellin regulated protein [Arabidopsis suecica]
MAKFIVIFIVFSFLFATQFSNAKELENPSGPIHKEGGEGSLTIGQCPAACNVRCSATSHKKPCLFYCNYCCNKCLCVPSGTYGHKEECPCYNNWKTQEGGPKCP